jgi:hypothetical protein
MSYARYKNFQFKQRAGFFCPKLPKEAPIFYLPISSTIKTDHHDTLTEILLKVALNTIKQTKPLFSIVVGEIC